MANQAEMGDDEISQVNTSIPDPDAKLRRDSPLNQSDIPTHSIATETTSAQKHLQKNNKICFYWLHYGNCTRDPARPEKKPGEDCSYLHHLGPNEEKPTMSFVPFWRHRAACGIEICPFKDGAGRDKKKPKKQKQKSSTLEQAKMEQLPAEDLLHLGLPQGLPGTPLQETRATKVDSLSPAGKKRKTYIRHRDDPEPQAAKRQKMDYDDTSPSHECPNSRKGGEETCFFWYHGSCARSKDRSGCHFKHGLTNPPTMVQPPPGYVHRKGGCGLAWCPGDSRQPSAKSSQRGDVRKPPQVPGDDVQSFKAKESDEDKPEHENWYLHGFDDIWVE